MSSPKKSRQFFRWCVAQDVAPCGTTCEKSRCPPASSPSGIFPYDDHVVRMKPSGKSIKIAFRKRPGTVLLSDTTTTNHSIRSNTHGTYLHNAEFSSHAMCQTETRVAISKGRRNKVLAFMQSEKHDDPVDESDVICDIGNGFEVVRYHLRKKKKQEEVSCFMSHFAAKRNDSTSGESDGANTDEESDLDGNHADDSFIRSSDGSLILGRMFRPFEDGNTGMRPGACKAISLGEIEYETSVSPEQNVAEPDPTSRCRINVDSVDAMFVFSRKYETKREPINVNVSFQKKSPIQRLYDQISPSSSFRRTSSRQNQNQSPDNTTGQRAETPNTIQPNHTGQSADSETPIQPAENETTIRNAVQHRELSSESAIPESTSNRVESRAPLVRSNRVCAIDPMPGEAEHADQRPPSIGDNVARPTETSSSKEDVAFNFALPIGIFCPDWSASCGQRPASDQNTVSSIDRGNMDLSVEIAALRRPTKSDVILVTPRDMITPRPRGGTTPTNHDEWRGRPASHEDHQRSDQDSNFESGSSDTSSNSCKRKEASTKVQGKSLKIWPDQPPSSPDECEAWLASTTSDFLAGRRSSISTTASTEISRTAVLMCPRSGSSGSSSSSSSAEYNDEVVGMTARPRLETLYSLEPSFEKDLVLSSVDPIGEHDCIHDPIQMKSDSVYNSCDKISPEISPELSLRGRRRCDSTTKATSRKPTGRSSFPLLTDLCETDGFILLFVLCYLPAIDWLRLSRTSMRLRQRVFDYKDILAARISIHQLLPSMNVPLSALVVFENCRYFDVFHTETKNAVLSDNACCASASPPTSGENAYISGYAHFAAASGNTAYAGFSAASSGGVNDSVASNRAGNRDSQTGSSSRDWLVDARGELRNSCVSERPACNNLQKICGHEWINTSSVLNNYTSTRCSQGREFLRIVGGQMSFGKVFRKLNVPSAMQKNPRVRRSGYPTRILLRVRLNERPNAAMPQRGRNASHSTVAMSTSGETPQQDESYASSNSNEGETPGDANTGNNRRVVINGLAFAGAIAFLDNFGKLVCGVRFFRRQKSKHPFIEVIHPSSKGRFFVREKIMLGGYIDVEFILNNNKRTYEVLLNDKLIGSDHHWRDRLEYMGVRKFITQACLNSYRNLKEMRSQMKKSSGNHGDNKSATKSETNQCNTISHIANTGVLLDQKLHQFAIGHCVEPGLAALDTVEIHAFHNVVIDVKHILYLD